MDILKVIDRLKELRANNPLSSSQKAEIESLYYQITGKFFVKTSCIDCYSDACIEAILYLNKHGKMKEKSNYSLKNGVVLQPEFGGVMYTNDNITDEVAERYLGVFPKGEMYFATLPTDYKKRIDERMNRSKVNEKLLKELVEAFKNDASEDSIVGTFKGYKINDKAVTKKLLAEHIVAAKDIVEKEAGNKE